MKSARQRAVTPDPLEAGQESVWDFPRPPRVEPARHHLVVRFDSTVLADTTRGLRVLETSHPPTYYFPSDDCELDALVVGSGGSFCEWKGHAVHYDLALGEATMAHVAWSYPNPTPAFAELRDHLAFYPAKLTCTVDGEVATPQPGGFYGGWVTSAVAGPFKGAPGTAFW